MSPLSTALPPPAVEIVDSWYYPPTSTGEGKGIGLAISRTNQRNATVQPSIAFGTYGASGSTGATSQLVGGRTFVAAGPMPPGRVESCRLVTTTGAIGGGMKPPMEHGSYGPASEFATGVLQAPSSVVNVYGVSWCCSDAVDNWPDDTTGFAFSPNTGVITDNLRPGSLPFSGFGLFFNSDGAGGSEVEYVSWLGAATVERVPIPAGFVPDMALWNSARFTIVSAAAGREAQVSIEVNSRPFLFREFSNAGSPDIPLPSAISATALHYVFSANARLGGGEFFSYTAYGYGGRFNPAGQELQPFGV